MPSHSKAQSGPFETMAKIENPFTAQRNEAIAKLNTASKEQSEITPIVSPRDSPSLMRLSEQISDSDVSSGNSEEQAQVANAQYRQLLPILRQRSGDGLAVDPPGVDPALRFLDFGQANYGHLARNLQPSADSLLQVGERANRLDVTSELVWGRLVQRKGLI